MYHHCLCDLRELFVRRGSPVGRYVTELCSQPSQHRARTRTMNSRQHMGSSCAQGVSRPEARRRWRKCRAAGCQQHQRPATSSIINTPSPVIICEYNCINCFILSGLCVAIRQRKRCDLRAQQAATWQTSDLLPRSLKVSRGAPLATFSFARECTRARPHAGSVAPALRRLAQHQRRPYPHTEWICTIFGPRNCFTRHKSHELTPRTFGSSFVSNKS